MNGFHFVKVLILFSFILQFWSCSQSGDPDAFYHPAEFEPSESVSFVWTDEYFEIVPELIGKISQKDRVTIFMEENTDTEKIHALLEKYNSDINNIRFREMKNMPDDNAWIRDFGPAYLVNDHGDAKIVNFKYFGKANSFVDKIALEKNLPVVYSSLNSSGGAREVNGKGTIILCETHELDINAPRSINEIEEEIKKVLQLKKVIWLKKGIPQDDSPLNGPLHDRIFPNGLNGHVDEFCRFVNDSTVLISYLSDKEAKRHPILSEAQRRLDENYKILAGATDQDGKKLRIVKVPFAPMLITDRSTASEIRYVTSVSSYLNFIITNSYVVMPSYTEVSNDRNREEIIDKEKEMQQVLQSAFPEKEVIKVQASGLNHFSGGFHCVSIHEPKF